MKHCPECNKNYADPTLSFCLSDGAPLIYGEAVHEPETAVFSDELPSETPTRHIDPLTTAPSGPQRAAGMPAPTAFRARNVPLLILGGLAVVAVLASVFGYRYYKSAGAKQIESVAVLPFENRSGTSDTDYLSDGLADSLIYRLTQLPNLKVSPTSSVMRYKGKETDVAQIARELNVDAVMSGRLVQRGEDLNISVQLIDARSQKLIWAEQYDRNMADLLTTQREIARDIVDKLKLKVSPQERALAKHYTESNEAYQYYLKGRFYWNQRTAENIKKANGEFQKAADADPTFALAYVGLADCYLVMEQYAGIPSSETVPNARSAALRALQIDDSLAEAHTSLGDVYQQQWQPAEAENEYKRAIDLNPNYATTHHWYSILLTLLGRPDEALAEIQLAQRADPLSPIITINLGAQYLLRDELDTAAAQYQKALELNPNFPRALTDLGFIYAKQGHEQDAIAYLQRAAEVSGRANEELGFLGYGYGILGKRAEAMKVLKELETRHSRRECPAMYPAAVYAAIGEKDTAFTWLEKDFQARTALLPYITILPIYDTIRDDPRYTDLLRRIGFR